jgi:hypothetical protein
MFAESFRRQAWIVYGECAGRHMFRLTFVRHWNPFATIVAASSLLKGCTTVALCARLAKPGHARPALDAG